MTDCVVEHGNAHGCTVGVYDTGQINVKIGAHHDLSVNEGTMRNVSRVTAGGLFVHETLATGRLKWYGNGIAVSSTAVTNYTNHMIRITVRLSPEMCD